MNNLLHNQEMSNSNINLMQEIYLGVLLHQIGKFIYKVQELTGDNKNECTVEKFISEHFGKIDILKEDIEKIINATKQHIIIADKMVSSERDNEENSNPRGLLCSILSSISLSDEYNPSEKRRWFYIPEKISSENVFPKEDCRIKENNSDNDLIGAHKNLLNEFIEEINKLQGIKSLEALCTSLYFLLYKYTSRISSYSNQSVSDITLFDHIRSVAGLIHCLTSFIKKEEELNNYENIPKEFLFIKGDLKGIQKFIYYNVKMDQAGSAKGVSKRLRGRSFLVSMFTEIIANIFIEQLALTESNLLYSGGGHFNIIAPYNNEVQNKINELTKKINLAIHNKFGGRISLIIGTTKCDETLYSDTGKFIEIVNFNLLQQKNVVHKNYLEEIIFQTEYEKNNEKNEQEIGQKLPYTKYIVELTAKDSKDFTNNGECLIAFEEFNKFYFFIEESEETYNTIYNLLKANKDKIVKVKLLKLNDSDFLEYSKKLCSCSCFSFPISFSFKYFGQYTPKNKYGDVIEFEELSKLNYKDNDKLSYPLLGVMRLDVDNLGSIFEFGLGDKSKLSRIASLSRELDLFFSGYFNELAKTFKVYIVYSGGDDAFIVGSWYNILHFAKKLYEDFKKFSCNNPDLSFSAGIFFCHENYPVARFAQKAADLEELSKKFKQDNGKEKNAITVFDHTLSWDSYCTMIDFAEKLFSHTNQDGVKDKHKLNRSLVHRLLRIIKSSLSRDGSVNTDKLYKNVAQLHYLFARHGYDADRINKAQDSITKDIITIILKEFSKEKIIKNYLVPTNYVILKTRKIKN